MEDPVVNTRTARLSSYIVAFLITAFIFATAVYASNYFNNRRVVDIQATQDKISIDILSLETQFDLLAEHSCKDISENSVLSTEIQPLAQRLSYLESQSQVNQDELMGLKRYYTLLQIKDLLLMQKVADKCKLKPVFILYFYSNAGDCKECEQQGYVLTGLAQKYPTLRIYSFDYNLTNSALRTLVDINNIRDEMPALVINNEVYYGLHTMDDIEQVLPELSTLKQSTSTAATTTTKKK
jgi:regulator of replication initiation timing